MAVKVINKRSELRDCFVINDCGGLETLDGEPARAGDAWRVSAEYIEKDTRRIVREFSRWDGRTVIVLPCVYKEWG